MYAPTSLLGEPEAMASMYLPTQVLSIKQRSDRISLLRV